MTVEAATNYFRRVIRALHRKLIKWTIRLSLPYYSPATASLSNEDYLISSNNALACFRTGKADLRDSHGEARIGVFKSLGACSAGRDYAIERAIAGHRV